jgi:hypothetical protein
MSSIPPSSMGGSSPPGSGSSTPRRIPNRSPNREVDRMGVMTLVRSERI